MKKNESKKPQKYARVLYINITHIIYIININIYYDTDNIYNINRTTRFIEV